MFLFCGVLEHFFLHFTFPGICYNVKKYEDNPIFFFMNFLWKQWCQYSHVPPLSPVCHAHCVTKQYFWFESGCPIYWQDKNPVSFISQVHMSSCLWNTILCPLQHDDKCKAILFPGLGSEYFYWIEILLSTRPCTGWDHKVPSQNAAKIEKLYTWGCHPVSVEMDGKSTLLNL